MGKGVDAKFDETLQSLGKIAQKHAKPVVDSIMRWRNENVGSDQAVFGFEVDTFCTYCNEYTVFCSSMTSAVPLATHCYSY